MRRLLFGLLLPVLLSPVHAAGPRLVDSMEDPALYRPGQPELGHKWTGAVSLETADFKEGKGCLRFDINSARADQETYPQYARSLDPAGNDWTPYQTLRYWVKVESRDNTVPFKNMCVVVYNGDSPFQQFVTHQVPVGRWVQLSDSIMGYNRDRVSGLILYLYETNPTWRDNYTWYVDGLELLPAAEGAVAFDGLAAVAKPQPVGPARHTVETSRLRLELDARGRVAGFSSDGRRLYRAGRNAHAYSGLMVRDWRRGEEIVPVTGSLTAGPAGLTQEATLLQGLKVKATLETASAPLPGWLACHVSVRDTGRSDRPLTIYYAVPLRARGWTWWDDINTPRDVQGGQEFCSNPSTVRDPRVSPYPFCCLNDRRSGLGLVTRLDQPRLQRLVYSPTLGVLYVAWNLCLTPAATKQKQAADFTFYLAPVAAAWGLRAMAADYYRAFPDCFAKRVPKEGGWGCWGTYANNPKIPDLGFVYHWGPDSRGAQDMAEPVRYDNEHGYLALPYIEWTNMHVSMEKYEQASRADIMTQVRYIADPNRREPLPRYQYAFPYDDRLGPDYDGVMREVFQGYLNSLILTAEGLVYGEANKSEFSLLVAKYIPFNADPDIPQGAGAYFLNKWWPTIDKYYADHGARPDGFGWDNFYVSGAALDTRREHLAYADEPVTFNTHSLQPAILKDMSTYELQKQAVARLRKMGRMLIANQGSVSAVSATMPLLDVFGYEWNIGGAATYARTLAHHKPVCSLPCTAEHYRDPYVRDHLLYGAWPGGYADTSAPAYLALMQKYVPIIRRLTQAGWEPVTLVRSSDPAVQVERFGGTDGRPLLLSVRNNGSADAVARLTLEPPLACPARVTELVDGRPCTVADGQISLTAPAGQVLVLAL